MATYAAVPCRMFAISAKSSPLVRVRKEVRRRRLERAILSLVGELKILLVGELKMLLVGELKMLRGNNEPGGIQSPYI